MSKLHLLTPTSLCLAAFLATIPTAFAAPQQAMPEGEATQLQPVKVDATKAAVPVRFDVRVACPGIEDQLQNTLSSVWNLVEQTGTIRVQFHLDERGVSDVRSSGGPRDYRPYLRRAMNKLDCGSSPAPARAQELAFLLVIHDPDEQDSRPQHFALLQE